MKIQKQIDVCLLRKGAVNSLRVVQYDTGVQLVFNVLDFALPSGTTATLYVRKKSGKFVYQEKNITVEGNKVIVDLHNQALTEHGEAFYQLRFLNGADIITTFSSSMLVDRSLADADAVESETVVAAFEAKTAEQIAQIREAAQAEIALIQAEFPELYAMKEQVTMLTNSTANAIKGNLSSAVVFADDVSPVEHNPVVKVHGKNLFDTSKIAVQANTDNIYISAVGEGYIDITTKEAYDGNGHCVTFVKLKELCPQMQAGKQYALSGTTTAWNKMIYLKEIDLFWSYGTRQIVTEKMLECTIGFYGLNSIREQGFGTCRISNIQCEEGYDITDYTPYIDPSTVKVRRCGKNLLNPNAGSSSGKGLTFTNNGDGSFTVKGTATAAASFGLTRLTANPMYLHKGVTYTQSVIVLAGSMASVAVVPSVEDGSGNVTWNYFSNNETKTPEKHYKFRGYEVYVENGRTVDLTFKVQLEVSSVATAFEPYNGAEYAPAADGTVSGITSLSPNMTVLTDTEGVTIECEYNRDTKKYVDSAIRPTDEQVQAAVDAYLTENFPDGDGVKY